MKKAIVYIRVSTDEQADRGFSQRDQHERLMAYCERYGILVDEVLFEDHSAKTFNRPEWNNLLKILKKTRTDRVDFVLFTKWDRFSRNTADAYQMIRTLRELNVEPIAIEQPLDLDVPESKTILAVYLSMPEVDNDRRSLNVMYGMRRGKKEGRWMGKALPGYANKTAENGRKYIAIDEPEATHMRWAFEQIALDVFATEHIWMMAKERGLKCKRNSFWDAIKNPCYCGKIIVPAFKEEPMQLVQAVHEPLISESLFYKVQDVINGRRKSQHPQGARATTPDEFPLRRFLKCAVCDRLLTGSGSKGRRITYYYYHCKNECRQRHPVDLVNSLFILELKRFVPKKGMADLFHTAVCNSYHDITAFQEDERKRLMESVAGQQDRISKSRDLLLKEILTVEEYKTIKDECEKNILRAKAGLKDLDDSAREELNIEELVNLAIYNLQNLESLYVNATNEQKRHIIGSIFKEKWVFDGEKHRTGDINEAALLIYQLNSKLRHKKTGVRTKIRTNSGKVPSAGVEPARFPTGV